MNNEYDKKVTPIRPDVDIEENKNAPPGSFPAIDKANAPVRHFGVSQLNDPAADYLKKYANLRAEGPSLLPPDLTGVLCQPLGDGKVAFDIEADIPAPRKIRNACISGHMPGEEKRCPQCREARFNTLTSGDYHAAPNVQQIKDTITTLQTKGDSASDDYRFVLEYLGISPNHTDPTSMLVNKVPVMVGCDIGPCPDEAANLAAKVIVPTAPIFNDIHLGHRNVLGKTSMLTEMLTSFFANERHWVAEPFHLDPFSNRATRRKKKVQGVGDTLRMAPAKNGPIKRGDKNTTQYVKTIKPSSLLKGLVKKTEQ